MALSYRGHMFKRAMNALCKYFVVRTTFVWTWAFSGHWVPGITVVGNLSRMSPPLDTSRSCSSANSAALGPGFCWATPDASAVLLLDSRILSTRCPGPGFCLSKGGRGGGGGTPQHIEKLLENDLVSRWKWHLVSSKHIFFLCSGAKRVQQPLRGPAVTSTHGQWVQNHMQSPS